MAVTYMEISDRVGAHRPGLFRKTTREALADLVAQRWPVGRRKSVIKAFGLTDDEARAVINGTAAHATLDKVFDAGGWDLILALFSLLARWSAICGLWLILSVTLPLAVLFGALAWPPLQASEWARDRLKKLTAD